MKVFIEKEQKELEINFSGKIKELFEKLNIDSETHLAVKNNELVTEDEDVSEDEYVKIIPVVSGG